MKICIVAINCKIPKFLTKLKHILKCNLSFGQMNLPNEARNARREQWSADLLLKEIKKGEFAGDKVLGIVDVDIYVPELNFVFGLAEIGGKYCLVSMYRLHPEFYGQRNGKLFEERMLKECVHELGHCFGLRHCKGKCVMTYSNSIVEVDAKGSAFCLDCTKVLKIF